jgi:phytoene synthase
MGEREMESGIWNMGGTGFPESDTAPQSKLFSPYSIFHIPATVSPADYCRDLAAPPGSDLHYALLFQSPQQRRGLHALFALHSELQSAHLQSIDPGVAQLRLHWWQEEIARLHLPGLRHPGSIELQRVVSETDLDVALLQQALNGLVSLRSSHDAGEPDGWVAAFEPAYGPLWRSAAWICGSRTEPELDGAARIGALLGALARLRHPPPPELQLPPGHGERDAMAWLLVWIAAELDGARAALGPAGRRNLQFCVVMALLAEALCREMAPSSGRMARERVALTPIRKLWIAWRAHRRVRRETAT